MSYSFFDHTGDIGVRLSGRTLDELFQSAAASFTEAVTDPARIERRQSVSFTLESPALDLLLVDWLNEILYRFEVDQFLVSAVEVRITAPDKAVVSLHARLFGEPYDQGRHGIKVLIKAVTYHALEVREDADGWHATVVFDI